MKPLSTFLSLSSGILVIACLVHYGWPSEPSHQVRWVNSATNTVWVPEMGLPTRLEGNVVFGMRDDGVMVWRLP